MHDYYDGHVKDYLKRHDTHKELLRDYIEKQVILELLPRKRAKVLDLGCGAGRMASFIHGLGHSVEGMDSSPNMLEEASKRNPGIHFSQLDIEKESPRGKYDIVNMTRLFFHLRKQGDSLENIGKCLKQKGYVIFDFLNKNSLNPLYFAAISRRYPDIFVKMNSKHEMMGLLGDFNVVETRGVDFNPLMLTNATSFLVSGGLELGLSKSPAKSFASRIFVKAQRSR